VAITTPLQIGCPAEDGRTTHDHGDIASSRSGAVS